MATSTSSLGPVDPNSAPAVEDEKAAPWIIRKLVGSITGRVVMSTYESLRAAGTTVVCLSPWGDSSPLVLPCIRFRDLVVHSVIAATGGTAAIAAPVMGPISDVVVGSLGDTIFVEMGLHTGFEISTKVLDELVVDHPLKKLGREHNKIIETTGIKDLLITLRFKHTMSDANLGFYRSGIHQDPSLFASVKDYLAVEKGWFSPYLFASSRRPIIPRIMTPDIVFCHGPFLSGDYKIGETLLKESASVIYPCPAPEITDDVTPQERYSSLTIPTQKLKNMLARSRTPSPEPALTPLPAVPAPRRLVVILVGIKPHRHYWTTSQRPEESVINYQLLNGCPAIVLPAQIGTPLIAWDTLTLEYLWKVPLPTSEVDYSEDKAKHGFAGVVNVLFEYLDLGVDWTRVELPNKQASDPSDEAVKKSSLRNALELLVAGAIKSGESKRVKKEVDKERAGIVMFRIR